MRCLYCKSTGHQVKVGFTAAASLRYLCKQCQRKYVADPKERGYSEKMRSEVIAAISWREGILWDWPDIERELSNDSQLGQHLLCCAAKSLAESNSNKIPVFYGQTPSNLVAVTGCNNAIFVIKLSADYIPPSVCLKSRKQVEWITLTSGMFWKTCYSSNLIKFLHQAYSFERWYIPTMLDIFP